MQPQMTSLMTKAKGTSMIIETIFENRFYALSGIKREWELTLKLKAEVQL